MLFEDPIIHACYNSNPHLSSRCACGSCVAVENPQYPQTHYMQVLDLHPHLAMPGLMQVQMQ